MAPVIFHIDVNSAYLSWTAVEQLKNGAEVDIRRIPAIIGGDQKTRHGVVLAKSISAKKYGIHTGEPVANAFRKCSDLQMFSPDHKMYSRKSKELMMYLRGFSPDIEQVSVDECYMDVTGVVHRHPSVIGMAVQMKDGIREKFGFTVNVGISENKLLAKMASDFEKPDKVHTLFPEEVEEKMWPLPVGELFMAGHSSVEVLKKLEIHTIGDLAKSEPALIELHLKSHGRMLWDFANGRGNAVVQSEREEAKGIGNSTTLREDITTEENAQVVLLQLAESVGRRLREAKKKAQMISVEIKYSDFKKVSHQQQTMRPIHDDETIYRNACRLFHELWNGQPVRLLGIRTSKLADVSEPEQLSLFDLDFSRNVTKEETENSPGSAPESKGRTTEANQEKRKKLSVAVDQIRKRFGDEAITRGSILMKEMEKKTKVKTEESEDEESDDGEKKEL